MNTTFCDLAHELETKNLLVASKLFDASNLDICGCASDSRYVRENDIFICKGKAFKSEYLQSALDKKACCYICDTSMSSTLSTQFPEIPHMVVSDIRKSMAYVSATSFGNPNKDLTLVGVTGTKGKSSVTYMLRSIVDCESPDKKASIIGSIETYDGIESLESCNTTPEAPDLWRHIYNASVSGKSPLIMEVSSQALKYDRVLGLPLDIGCFLNIGRDHISPVEHPDFEDYFSSKLKMFESCKTAVINLDSDNIDQILDSVSVCENVYTFSATTSEADLWAEDIHLSLGKVSFTACSKDERFAVTLNMPGIFNVDNALAAILMAKLLGCTTSQIQLGLKCAKVPGRMELLDKYKDVICLVDYAHNKLSYQKFFESVAQEFEGRYIVSVLGAPGGKAQERRVELPQEASKWADLLIYTEEDPALESAQEICEEMLSNTPQGANAKIIADRYKAIEAATKIAYEKKPSLLCLLGKGDETLQHIGDKFVEVKPDGTIFEEVMKEIEK